MIKFVSLWGKSNISWIDAGKSKPVGKLSARYFFLYTSKRASSSSFFLRYYSSLFAYYSASFLFLGGISYTFKFYLQYKDKWNCNFFL